eukprot:260493-Amphidinium_carterae.4
MAELIISLDSHCLWSEPSKLAGTTLPPNARPTLTHELFRLLYAGRWADLLDHASPTRAVLPTCAGPAVGAPKVPGVLEAKAAKRSLLQAANDGKFKSLRRGVSSLVMALPRRQVMNKWGDPTAGGVTHG